MLKQFWKLNTVNQQQKKKTLLKLLHLRAKTTLFQRFSSFYAWLNLLAEDSKIFWPLRMAYMKKKENYETNEIDHWLNRFPSFLASVSFLFLFSNQERLREWFWLCFDNVKFKKKISCKFIAWYSNTYNQSRTLYYLLEIKILLILVFWFLLSRNIIFSIPRGLCQTWWNTGPLFGLF